MTLKKRLISLLLAAMLVFLPLYSCSEDELEQDEPDTEDEFTGSIAGEDTDSEDDSSPTVESENKLPLGDENNVTDISSYEELKSKLTQKGTFNLTADITITDTDFKPFGSYVYPFLGTFNGNGHTITFTANQSSEGIGFSSTFKFVYCGLFAVTRNATINGLTVQVKANAASSTQNCFVLSGGIAGYMINTTVQDCKVSGEISAKSEFFNAYAGNVAGIIQGGAVNNCSSLSAKITAYDSENRAEAGGIAGYIIEGTSVSKCNVTGQINAVSSLGVAYAGGLAGNAKHSSFTACSVDADISSTVSKYDATAKNHGAVYSGGLIGVANGDSESEKTDFKRCYILKKTVTAMGNDNAAYAGGIAAATTYASFTHCYSLANITLNSGVKPSAAGSAFGSLDAAEFSIDGCFSTGGVTVIHSRTDFMYFGASYGYINNGAKDTIKNLIYNSEAVFSLNNNTTAPGINKSHGTAKDAEFFTIENCKSVLGWNAAEWTDDLKAI